MTMKNILALAIAVTTTAAFATPLMLVSNEEMLASNSAPTPVVAKVVADKDAPVIHLLAPKLPGSVSSPTPIELKFQATPPGKVKPETFKVLYGNLQIDITRRILSVTKVTESGVQVQEASLPKGKHKLMMLIEDSEGRVGNRLVSFEVN
jgi:hypothetical protein